MKMDTHINLRLPSSLHADLAERAREQGTSLSEAIRRAVDDGESRGGSAQPGQTELGRTQPAFLSNPR